MTLPRWMNELDEARATRFAGAVLAFNLADWVYAPELCPSPLGLVQALGLHLHRSGLHVARFGSARGLELVIPPHEPPPGPSPWASLEGCDNAREVIHAATALLRRGERPGSVLVVDHADHLAPAGRDSSNAGSPEPFLVEALHDWGLDDAIRTGPSFVVVLSRESSLSPLITRNPGYRSISIELPNADEREAFGRYLSDLARSPSGEAAFAPLDGNLSLGQVVAQSSGLRLRDLEALSCSARFRRSNVSRESIRATKSRAVAETARGLIELVDPAAGFEAVAGAEHAKEYFRRNVVPGWGTNYRGVPAGVVLAGVPGCGKSFLVRAVAKELASPCVVMRSVRDMWVGASERNLETVLHVIEALMPCIVWIDEIDQILGRRSDGASGDSGVNERLLGRLLEYTGSMEHRGRILWIGTTNRPESIDPALLDRFSDVIPFFTPTEQERAALFPILAAQVDRRIAPEVNLAEIARRPALEFLSVRALQDILVSAGAFADEDAKRIGAPIEIAQLDEAIGVCTPSGGRAETELAALSALRMARPKCLPWVGRNGLRPDRRWPSYLDAVIEPLTGRVREGELRNRIADLRTECGLAHAGW